MCVLGEFYVFLCETSAFLVKIHGHRGLKGRARALGPGPMGPGPGGARGGGEVRRRAPPGARTHGPRPKGPGPALGLPVAMYFHNERICFTQKRTELVPYYVLAS